MTLCIFRVCQMQALHQKDHLNSSQWCKLLTKVRKPPIRLMASKTLHKSQCVNRFLVVEHKGNPLSQRLMKRCRLLGSRLPTNDESRNMMHDRTTLSCDSKTNWGYGQHSKSRVLRSVRHRLIDFLWTRAWDICVNFYAIIIVLCISIDKSNIRTRSLRNTHSQETQHLSWETL